MRIEVIPLIFGIILALIGLGLLFDAWTPDHLLVKRERRRRPRAERHRGGEASIGLGVLAMAAAFIGRDTWRFSVVAVIAGTVLLLYGVVRNWRFLGELISNRGSLRRRSQTPNGPPNPPPDAAKAERRAKV
jgi:peptidoglycan/LPS O-acetylase OafA/YrhL